MSNRWMYQGTYEVQQTGIDTDRHDGAYILVYDIRGQWTMRSNRQALTQTDMMGHSYYLLVYDIRGQWNMRSKQRGI